MVLVRLWKDRGQGLTKEIDIRLMIHPFIDFMKMRS
jgi:hypothetical protein